MNALLAKLLGWFQTGMIAFTFLGEMVFNKLGWALPQFHTYMKDNKMMMFFGFMMIGNMAGQLVATGAFEIELDGQVVFSKLNLGRMPETADIMTAMSSL
jgi:selT/selW/selH-like putative selenoprotein